MLLPEFALVIPGRHRVIAQRPSSNSVKRYVLDFDVCEVHVHVLTEISKAHHGEPIRWSVVSRDRKIAFDGTATTVEIGIERALGAYASSQGYSVHVARDPDDERTEAAETIAATGDDVQHWEHDIFVNDDGELWRANSDSTWTHLGSVGDSESRRVSETANVYWHDIPKWKTLTPWEEHPSGYARVIRVASQNVKHLHKNHVWRMQCDACKSYGRPVVAYRTIERETIEHNLNVHGKEYLSDYQ